MNADKKTLSEIQILVQKAIQKDDAFPSRELVHVIAEKSPLSVAGRLRVYQDGYVLRLVEVLQQDFSRLVDVLGEERFEVLAKDFIDRFPSCYRNLCEYSRQFWEYVVALGDSSSHDASASILATMDWLELLSLDAPEFSDDILIDPKDIENGRAFRLCLKPSTQLWRVKDPRPSKVCHGEHESDGDGDGEIEIEIEGDGDGEVCLMSFRHLSDVSVEKVSSDCFSLLSFLSEPRSSEEIGDFLTRRTDTTGHIQDGTESCKKISKWLATGVLCAVT
jgi:hypothetical protein